MRIPQKKKSVKGSDCKIHTRSFQFHFPRSPSPSRPPSAIKKPTPIQRTRRTEGNKENKLTSMPVARWIARRSKGRGAEQGRCLGFADAGWRVGYGVIIKGKQHRLGDQERFVGPVLGRA